MGLNLLSVKSVRRLIVECLLAGNMDELLGMLHIKDLIAHALDREPASLSDLLRPVSIVSPSIRLLDLLQEMRLKRLHLALVVDEFGGMMD